MKDRTKRNLHPGWCIQFSDGTIFGSAHGYFATTDAFYAIIFDQSKEDTEQFIKDYGKEIEEDTGQKIADAKVVEAWQPLCERLRFDLSQLRRANAISPDKIFNIITELEFALNTVKNEFYKEEEEND